MPDQDKNQSQGSQAGRTALAKVQELFDKANAALVAWQEKFASVGPTIGEPPEIPDTPQHRSAQAKRQRHADAVAAGEMTYKDIALERQAEFAERFAAFPANDRATLNDWAARQEATHGSSLGVWEHHAMPWPLVFLAARYGAEVEHWPTALAPEDQARLASLEKKGTPRLALVEPLHVAAANKQARTRVHLFAAPEHKDHVASALARASAVAAPATPTRAKE